MVSFRDMVSSVPGSRGFRVLGFRFSKVDKA